MAIQAFSNFIQAGVSQAAASVGGLGSAVWNSTAPALISRVGDAAAGIFSARGGRVVLTEVGLYSFTAWLMEFQQFTRSKRMRFIALGAGMFVAVESYRYLLGGAPATAAGTFTTFLTCAVYGIGALDPLGLGPRLVAPIPPIPAVAPLPQVSTPT